MKVLISKKTGNYYYYKLTGDLHTKEGFVKKEELDSGKRIVLTNTNREFLCFNANNFDLKSRIKRGPQLITTKDLGYIAARTGMNKNFKVIEAGSGCGSATCFFAGICNEVVSYEILETNFKLTKKNVEFMGLSNVEVIHDDILTTVDSQENADLLFLDMPFCEKVVGENNLCAIKSGAYIVCYLPSVTQILDLTKVISTRSDLYLEEISEVSIREWKVWEKIARPHHRKEIDHTAFLVFIRKV